MKTLIGLVLLACAVTGRDYDIDCDNVNPLAKKFVDDRIPSALVFMISKTTCPYCVRAKKTLNEIGFHQDDMNIVELDDFDAQFKSDIQDYNWCITGGRTFPRVWANNQVVGGSDNTREGYWSGKLVTLAYQARLTRAAKNFVDTAIEGSKNKYLLISKRDCPFCTLAKMCLDKKRIYSDRVVVHDIQDWDTHDQIKEYAGELTGASSTPRIWFDRKLIGGYQEFKQWMGC